MSDWNAERYHDVSTPQQAWGRRILDGVDLAGDERALDVGCGTGHLTAVLAERLPRGAVVGLDRSESMIRTAAAWLRDRAPGVRLVLADAAALPFSSSFDLIFSTATFHWIHDHDALFRSIFHALRPGGRLIAQCGGEANLARLHERMESLRIDSRYASRFDGWTDPWNFANVESTCGRLAAAGFADIDVGLQEAPTTFPGPREYSDFVSTVCLRHHLSRLPTDLRPAFVESITNEAATDDPPFMLDYRRLNISARRPV